MTMPVEFIGVDVAKDWIDVFDPRTGAHSRHEMTPAALRAFARNARGTRVIFEASGGYDRPLAEALTHAGIPYSRVNPRAARDFARASGRLAKTDRVDARVLAQMGAALRPAPTAAPSPAQRRLSSAVSRREDIARMIVQEQNRLQQVADPWVAKRIAVHLRALLRERAQADRRIAELQTADPEFRARATRLRAVPGVGPQTAAILLAHLPELGSLDRRAIASLAGLAPQADDSGKRQGKRRVYGGRPQLRRALFIAALSAARCDPRFRAFRARLVEAGKPKKAAILAVARKLLTVLNAMIRDGAEYRSAG